MRIAIDAMGGDNAPDAIIEGTLDSLDQIAAADDEIILVGRKEVLLAKLPAKVLRDKPVRIVDAPEVIAMGESPTDALRKKRKSSIAIIAKMGAANEADAVISAGNTGAYVAACQLRMRNLAGVNRPGISVVFPTFKGPVTMCDVGANIACKPINLYQYAVMASIYSRHILGIEKPRVGIMSVGEEASKGNEVVKKTRELIKSDPAISFVGNIEGGDIFHGVCDVAITEGFVGNVVLKLTEGLVAGLFNAIKHELMQESLRLAMKFKPVMMRIYNKYDYHAYGGAPLLGVNGTAIICHGSSKGRTIKNAIHLAKTSYTKKINDQIVSYLSRTSVRNTDELPGHNQ